MLLVNADSVNSHFLISVSFIYFSCLIIAGRKPDTIGCGAKYWADTFGATGRWILYQVQKVFTKLWKVNILRAIFLIFLIFTWGYVYWLERERDHQLVASRTCPNQGSNLPPRYVPWLGIEPATFWCRGWCSNQLSHPARARAIFLVIHSLCKCSQSS